MSEKLSRGVTIVAPLLLLLIGFVLGYLVKGYFQARREPLTPKVDTLYISRLKVAEIGSFSPQLSIGEVKIPRYAFFSDTTHTKDTEFIYLPREVRLFSDKDSTYKAWVSGYDPKLDSLEFIEKTQIITKTMYEPIKRNKLYLQGEFMYDSSPYLPLTLNYAYQGKWWELNGGGGYDFYSKSVVVRAGVKINLANW